MPAEDGDAQLGGLRREHIVAAALVAAVTIVLGFGSGFGVLDARGDVPADPVAGAPAGPPPQADAAQPGGKAVGGTVRPGTTGPTGTAGAPAPEHHRPGSGGAPSHAQVPGEGAFGTPSDPSAPSWPAPGFVVAPEPQCPGGLGLLDQVLALIARVVGGAAPAQALADSGAQYPDGTAVTGRLPAPGVLDPDPDGTVLLPRPAEDDQNSAATGTEMVPVVGLMPLLDTIAERRDARSADAPALLGGNVAQPLAAPGGGGDAADAGEQLGQLAALLDPLGFEVDPLSGDADPLLLPVLGPLGYPGVVPADAAAAVR